MNWCGREGVACNAGETLAGRNSLSRAPQFNCNEIRQILINDPRIRFAEKGNVKGNDVYVAFGRTFGGRYLLVFFVY